jgi:fructokinase
MTAKNYSVVGLGEVLWDILPSGKQLGGAPTNFAYITNLLGDSGIVASRVGDDDLGREARAALEKLKLRTTCLQRDADHPTGTVKVQLDSTGQPKFQISDNVAWDFLAMTPEWNVLAQNADAICFGSLAQRSPVSQHTIRDFIAATRPDATRIFDVNLREAFFSEDVIAQSVQRADIVKLNDDELPRVMALLSMKHETEESSATALLRVFNLKLVCVTRGAKGSLLVSAADSHKHPGCSVKAADTIGAGDAFTAGLVHHYLRGASLAHMNEAANRVGSWVASQVGGTPMPGAAQMREVFAAGRE